MTSNQVLSNAKPRSLWYINFPNENSPVRGFRTVSTGQKSLVRKMADNEKIQSWLIATAFNIYSIVIWQ